MWRSSETMKLFFEAIENCPELIVCDTETTGLNADKDRIIQISAIKYKIVDCNFVEYDRLNKYINPEFCISPKITQITGISDMDVENEPIEKEVFEKFILPFFGEQPAIFVAYNLPFDKRFISEMYKRNGKTFSPIYELDALNMARDLVDSKDAPKNEKTNKPCYKLSEIAKLYGVDKNLKFHDSMNDVIATGNLLKIFYSEYQNKIKESMNKNIQKKQAKIFFMNYWPGYRGNSRIYIHTSLGKFYYDIMKKSWDKDKANPIELDEVNMEQLKKDAFKMANASNDKEFSHYKN